MLHQAHEMPKAIREKHRPRFRGKPWSKAFPQRQNPAAWTRLRFEHHDLVPRLNQLPGRGQSGKPGTQNHHPLARARCQRPGP